MLFLWIALVLLPLAVTVAVLLLRTLTVQVTKSREKLEEALWARRNRVPILLEVFKRNNLMGVQSEEIIGVRSRLMSLSSSLTDQLLLEKTLTDLLQDSFRKASAHPPLQTDALYHALIKEFSDDLEKIRMAINDYDYILQKARKYIFKKERPLLPI